MCFFFLFFFFLLFFLLAFPPKIETAVVSGIKTVDMIMVCIISSRYFHYILVRSCSACHVCCVCVCGGGGSCVCVCVCECVCVCVCMKGGGGGGREHVCVPHMRKLIL